MGMASLISGALKHVPWVKVADAALQYGPDLISKLKALRQTPQEELETVQGPEERIAELEKALLLQAEVLRLQSEKLLGLEQECRNLQSAVKVAIGLSVLVLAACLVLAFRG